MLARFEERSYSDINVFSARYKNLSNLAHWHKEAEIIKIESGTAEIGINKEVFRAEKNDVFFVKKGDIHYITGFSDSIISILIFDSELAGGITSKYCLLSPKLSVDYDLSSLIKTINSEMKTKKLFFKEKIYSYIDICVAKIFENEEIKEQDTGYSSIFPHRDILEYIDNNFATVTFPDAVKKSGYCQAHFSRLFKKLTGKSFTDYVNYLRIEKAARMILDKQGTITSAAYTCGFSSIRHFNRVFKKETGFCPKEIRNNKAFSFFNVNPQKAFDPTLENSQLLREW